MKLCFLVPKLFKYPIPGLKQPHHINLANMVHQRGTDKLVHSSNLYIGQQTIT